MQSNHASELSFLFSARLRQALGIGPSGIPPYISRMHLLGYPPGYKIQAEEQGLLLYHDPNTGNPLIMYHKRRDILLFLHCHNYQVGLSVTLDLPDSHDHQVGHVALGFPS